MVKIMLDPGHGGSDPGAVGPSKLKEKEVNLTVSQKLRKRLEINGISVLTTRDTDERLNESTSNDLAARCDLANRANVDYYLSIHCNSFNSQAEGTETYCVAFGGEAEKLAKQVQSCLVEEIKLRNRGIKTANFAVLRDTDMPAILVEIAFISNPNEEALLADDAFLDQVVTGIAKGVCSYLGIPFLIHAPTQPSPWAKKAWEWGILHGITDGSRPLDQATREECISMLHRFDAYLDRKYK